MRLYSADGPPNFSDEIHASKFDIAIMRHFASENDLDKHEGEELMVMKKANGLEYKCHLPSREGIFAEKNDQVSC